MWCVLIDGVRVNSATTGTNALEHMPLAQIERIEVLRGPASSLYGADAIGGVIQIFTRDGRRHQRPAPSVGSDHARAARRHRPHVGGRRVVVAATPARRRAASRPPTTSHPFSFNPDDDPYRNENVNARTAAPLGRGHSISAARRMSDAHATHFDAGAGQRRREPAALVEPRARERRPHQRRLAQHCCAWRAAATTCSTSGAFPSTFDTDQDQFTWQNDIAAVGASTDRRRRMAARET